MTKKTKEKLIAYHEAGHAIADFRAEFLPHRITVVPDSVAGTLGSCAQVYGNCDGSQRHEAVIGLLAGYAAAMQYRKRNGLPSGRRPCKREMLGSCSDFAGARQALGFRGSQLAPLKAWFDQSFQFVRREWPAIRAVANEVVRAKTLDRDEIEAIITAVDQTRTPESAGIALASVAEMLGRELPPGAYDRPALFLRRAYLAQLRALTGRGAGSFTF
jgi:hypothetical protein